MHQSLNLDKRQRAMLREIGVRVWQPMAATAAAPAAADIKVPAPVAPGAAATKSVAPAPIKSSQKGVFVPQKAAALTPSPTPLPTHLPTAAEVRTDSSAVSWGVGQALALYPQATSDPRPRWLVLAETSAAALPPEYSSCDTRFNPFDGDAGKLLDNMLRAVRLHQTGSVMLVPLVRRVGAEAASDPGMSSTLASVVQAVQPDVVLVMGRLAAQALLRSSEPFGKLRGRLHALHGVPAIVTHDAAYLLRSPLEKARAWEDLCLALSVL